MMLPPNTGRVWRRYGPAGSMESSVQSAVEPRPEARGDPGEEGPSHRRAAAQDDHGFFLLEDFSGKMGMDVLVEITDGRIVDHPHLLHAVGEEIVCNSPHSPADEQGRERLGQVLLQLTGCADHFRHDRGEPSFAVFGEHADPRGVLHAGQLPCPS